MRTRSQRLLSMVLALSMLLTFLPVSAFAESTPPPYAISNEDTQELDDDTYTDGSNTYTYELNGNTATLTKFTGTTANVPNEVTKGTETYRVTAIGAYAFADPDYGFNTTLKSVTLPSSIKTIGDYAFYYCTNTNFTSITIPDGVTEIKEGTFMYCTSLEKVNLPNSITSIGVGAFSLCSALKYIKLPDNLTEVKDHAFQGANLETIDWPVSLTSVGDSAFYNMLVSIQGVLSPKPIQTIIYHGTQAQWDEMKSEQNFATTNSQLTTAKHFYCAAYSITPATPTTPPQQPGTNPPESTDKPGTQEKPNEPTTPEQKPNEPTPPEAPAVEEDDTAAIGYAAAAVTAAFVGWGAYRIGSEVYLKYLLPKDVLLPQNRIQLAELLWEDAGRPAPADAAPYADVDANDTDARQAARWAVENGLLTLPNAEKPEEFVPYRSVSYAKSARAWNKAQQLKENAAR